MKIEYKLTYDDWKAFLDLRSSQKGGRRILYAIYYFVIPALTMLFLTYVLYARLNGHTSTAYNFIAPVATLDALAILLSIACRSRTRKSFNYYKNPISRKLKDTSSTSEAVPECSLDFDDDRILSTRPGFDETIHSWTDIHAVIQNNKIMLLLISQSLYICVPLDKLSKDQRTELNELVARHVVRKK
jgi:hypothetical protein